MTTNYDRRQVNPADAWLLDSNGKIVGVEIAQAKAQKTFLPGSATDGAIDGTPVVNIQGNVTGNVSGNLTGNVVASSPSTNSANIGTPGTGVTAAEYGDGRRHTTVLTLGAGCVLPAIAGGAALGVGALIYTFPAGAQIIWGSRMSVGITQTQAHINADTPTVGLGHVIASGAVSVLSGTATFQSISVGKAAANCTGTATVQTVNPTASPFTLITESGGVKSVYFNAACTWSASGDAAAALAGTVTLDWDTLA